jgi:hypothetical protein
VIDFNIVGNEICETGRLISLLGTIACIAGAAY